MMRPEPMHPALPPIRRAVVLCALAAWSGRLWGAESADPRLQQVIEQNAKLQEQVATQQKMIEELRTQVNQLARDGAQRDRRIEQLDDGKPAHAAARNAAGTVIVTGEGAAGFFSSGPDGQFPKSEFRVEEALLHVEARIVQDVYAFAELKLTERENTGSQLYLGEFYIDFEELGARLGHPGALGLRVGRIDVPFGEEYLSRDAIDNPLISHSLADFWGVDEGLELYGKLGAVQYVFAVQNGSTAFHQDFNADKALTLRLGGEPAPWLHLGASAMRTGRLNSAKDFASELWVGNGVFVSLGNPATTTHFGADLLQVEARAKWRGGHLHAALGRAWYDDNDTSRDNSRTVDFHSLELVQQLGDGWFGAGRYSRMSADLGFPLVGQGPVGKYLLGGIATKYLNRLSLGFGYQFGEPLVWKTEYSWERGRTTAGWKRDRSDTLSSEIAVKF